MSHFVLLLATLRLFRSSYFFIIFTTEKNSILNKRYKQEIWREHDSSYKTAPCWSIHLLKFFFFCSVNRVKKRSSYVYLFAHHVIFGEKIDFWYDDDDDKQCYVYEYAGLKLKNNITFFFKCLALVVRPK